ncbi:MAG TPA: BrnT family toxin [Thermoanaerobaculia bacterium]|nr:BrnT family toxin [Thermoanaerobaculia bacterium]
MYEHEVVEVFEGQPRFRFVERGHREGEHVYSAMGQTDAGRYVVVFFVHKADGRALPVSARDVTLAERKRYERK